MSRFLAWLLSPRFRNAPLRLAEAAFRAKYPAAALHHVEAVAEDENSYIVQVLYDSTSCRMASFWDVSKAGCKTRELQASELKRLFASLPPLAAEEDLYPHHAT